MERRDKIAVECARSVGYDSLCRIGAKGGCLYFRAFNKAPRGHKTGLPHIVKIDGEGGLFVVNNLKERMWAIKEEVKNGGKDVCFLLLGGCERDEES
ncbi:MAG: hypothetical protein IKZ37_04775 [Bacteroidaceae bacterium]|nr:hypothetical protein [Bacteroidaceae bacterium]